MDATRRLHIKELLRQHDLRPTACREEILYLFFSSPIALAHADLERNLAESHDRVTIYRTLKTFLDKEIIHKVLDDSGNLKYAMPKSQQTAHHSHIHFKCNICGHTNCLEDVLIPPLQLPEGYQLTEASLLVQGVCQLCNKPEDALLPA
jgi:Fur family ferric uptake transcriptional regulator